VSTGDSKKINRVCARIVPDSDLAAPAIIAHGRIVVLGGDNHRIHEEIITAGGIIKEGRLIRMNVGETNAAIGSSMVGDAPAEIKKRLSELWPRQRDAVSAALEARMVERTKNLESILADRAEKEVKKMKAVLGELKTAIEKELEESSKDAQLTFNWTGEEKQQRNDDLSALERRVKEIPGEIDRETAHIRSRYEKPTPRLFPVALTYLIPRKAVSELRGGGR
jgi:hypothetical protein